MPYVYLLSEHDEGGSENVVATLDRNALPAMLGRYLAGDVDPEMAVLLDLLARADEDLAAEQKFCLGRGWGGVQLYVVEISQG